MESFIKSPLNYTGNKYRILSQILPYIPEKADMVVDLFCGGATVGANINGKKVIFIDNNRPVIELLNYLARCRNVDKLIKDLISITDKFNLSCSGLNGYSMGSR